MGTMEEHPKPAPSERKRERSSHAKGEEHHRVTDPRFSAAETDPRFARVPKRARKAAIDDRFKQTLKKNPGFRKSQTPVDRFGRPKRGHHLHESLRDVVAEDGESDSDSDDEIKADHTSIAAAQLDSDSDDSDSDDSDIAEFMEDPNDEQPEEIPRGKATRRLAVIGLDWSTTRAVDIYACLDSFCPPGKSVKSVEVHPSRFGLERLAEEATFGPQVMAKEDLKVYEDAKKQNLVNDASKATTEDERDAESESEDDESESEDDGVEEKQRKEQVALRKYEEERLNYYYAVVQFEDVKAADAVYEQCDGVEYAQSGRAFDLRFVPDDMEMQTTPRDRANSLPGSYRPPNVTPSSLNTSNVKLSWDADDPERVILKKKAIGNQQLDEENLKAYLASSSEDEDAKEHNVQVENRRKLLLGSAEDEVEEEPDMGMEITFEPGMLEKAEEIVKRKKDKDERKDETQWEARMRRLQERKTEKRKKRKEEREAFKADAGTTDGYALEDDEDNTDTAGFSDPFFSHEKNTADGKQRKTGKRKGATMGGKDSSGENDDIMPNEAVEAARKRSELELLVMDHPARGDKKTGSMREMLAAAESSDDEDRSRGKGGKKQGKSRRSRHGKRVPDKIAEPSTMDVQDPRFQGLFDSHLFAMDPTHSKFKDNQTTQKILKEKTRRAKMRSDTPSAPTEMDKKASQKNGGVRVEKANAANSELRQLAARLKARAKASGKKTRKR